MARPPKRNADWFQHPSDLRSWPEVRALRNEYGHEGVAVFYMLLEVLCGSDGFRLRLGALDLEVLAADLGTSSQQVLTIVTYLKGLNVFELEGQTLSCAWVDAWMAKLMKKRVADRKRKGQKSDEPHRILLPDTELFTPPPPPEEPERFPPGKPAENSVFQSENGVFPPENPGFPPGKSHTVQDSTETVQNSTEKKGGFTPQKKDTPSFNDSDFSPEASPPYRGPDQREPQKEKSSAQKEKAPTPAQIAAAQQVFLQLSEGYVWGGEDERFLPQLLGKLQATIQRLGLTAELVGFFRQFLKCLPRYWRTQKFTIPLLNLNYNQIVGEIKPFWKQLQPAKPTASKPANPPPEPANTATDAERKQWREEQLAKLAAQYQAYLDTDVLVIPSYLLAWMYLTGSGWLEDTPANRQRWQAEAKTRIRERWQHRAGTSSGKEFRVLLEDFERHLRTTKASELETRTQEVAVDEFFTQCKEQQISSEELLRTLSNPTS